MGPVLTFVVSGRRPRLALPARLIAAWLDDAAFLAFLALRLLGAAPPAAGLLRAPPPPGTGLLSGGHKGSLGVSTEPSRGPQRFDS